MDYSQKGNFEKNELCIKKDGFTKGCVILDEPSTILDLSGFIYYGQIFEFQITTYWCEGNKSVTSPHTVEKN